MTAGVDDMSALVPVITTGRLILRGPRLSNLGAFTGIACPVCRHPAKVTA
nr:hypothetical protein [Paracoccus saliphilus]